ncbi:MAG: transglutaminase family protein [Terriglobia bacterium]|jgi:transglutaminase-like putative cysteine protease
MLYRITHSTRYVYPSPVKQCFNEARLTPRGLPGQQVREHSLQLHPFPAFLQNHIDYFGNEVSTFAVYERHDRFEAVAASVVDVQPAGAEILSSPAWEKVRDLLAHPPDQDSIAASEFIFDSPYISALADLQDYARPTFTPGRPLLSAMKELTGRIHDEFKYRPRSTSIDTPLVEVLRNRQGVCQDFAHLMIGALRSLRLSARYVSGYIRSGSRFQGAAASHAWVSVFDPENGWLSFDPTNNMMASEAHITLAWGRDYGDVTPMKGLTLGGGGQSVQVEVRVQPLAAAPFGQES